VTLVQGPLEDVLASSTPQHYVRLDLYVCDVEAVFVADGENAIFELRVSDIPVVAIGHVAIWEQLVWWRRGLMGLLLLLAWLHLSKHSSLEALLNVIS
jgi:hypothetical protein